MNILSLSKESTRRASFVLLSIAILRIFDYYIYFFLFNYRNIYFYGQVIYDCEGLVYTKTPRHNHCKVLGPTVVIFSKKLTTRMTLGRPSDSTSMRYAFLFPSYSRYSGHWTGLVFFIYGLLSP